MVRRLVYHYGPRSRVLTAVFVVGIGAYWQLGPDIGEAIPSAAGWKKIGDFFSAAVSPAMQYEHSVPAGTDPLLLKSLKSIWLTLAFAIVSVSLALIGGGILSFISSSAWWEDDPNLVASPARKIFRNTLAPAMKWTARTIMVMTRSVHELLWAVLFMSAMGLSWATAILAIAIPFSGIFAKIFSEMIDEAPRDAAYALRELGASPLKVFCFGLLPRAIPDMTAYACYRLECGMRSAAIMGFFGFQTLGYYLALAFDETHFHEVWTYLYSLIALIIVVDIWSGWMRRRLVG
ncbi:MAG: ABC transporter permease subunit [Planctomycetales bacterium]